jgi:hypothetical protein
MARLRTSRADFGSCQVPCSPGRFKAGLWKSLMQKEKGPENQALFHH